MFKLIQLLAAFVVKQYHKEAERLHEIVRDADEYRDDLLSELDMVANSIDGHVAAAKEATERAEALAKLVK